MQAEIEARRPGTNGEQHPHVKYRSRFEIASTILHGVVDGPATKTRLMYGSFLSFAQINEYLGFLLANELVKKEEATRMYSLTEKGMRFLHIYEELSALIGAAEPIHAA
jgi:predicted transcriptional regulator